MPHQRLLFIMIRLGFVVTITTMGWNFPLHEVARPECRGEARDQLNNDCKVDIIAGSHDKTIGKLLFSALWGTSYEKSQTPKSGGHPSLDMPSSPGTPVYTIGDGTVVNAGERAGYGLSITIKHTLNESTIYSNYSHLNEILVKKGETVKGNTLIGKVGCTGFSISGDPTRCGNHLDFQITTAKSPSHPYGYGDCAEGYMTAVEQGTCLEKLNAYTIDPLVFFATYTDFGINYPLIAPHITQKTTEQEHSAAPSAPAETNNSGKTLTAKEKYALAAKQRKSGSIFARIRAQNPKPTVSSPPTKETVKDSAAGNTTPPTTTKPINTAGTTLSTSKASLDIGTISWSRNNTTTFSPLKVYTLTFSITDPLGNTYTEKLPKAFSVKIDNTDVGSFFPNSFNEVSTSKKHLFLQTRKAGKALISFWYGDQKVSEQELVVK